MVCIFSLSHLRAYRYEAYEELINAVDKWIDKMNRLELA